MPGLRAITVSYTHLDVYKRQVKELYSDFGRESIDPVVLVKIAMLQYIFGIPSMRQAIRELSLIHI